MLRWRLERHYLLTGAKINRPDLLCLLLTKTCADALICFFSGARDGLG